MNWLLDKLENAVFATAAWLGRFGPIRRAVGKRAVPEDE